MTRCPPAPSAKTDISTALFASVPEAMNATSGGLPPTSSATCCRACSTAARAARPKEWTEDGLPCRPPSQGSIASATRGSSGVVALWSR